VIHWSPPSSPSVLRQRALTDFKPFRFGGRYKRRAARTKWPIRE
jgi:hypothetical protein